MKVLIDVLHDSFYNTLKIKPVRALRILKI